MFIYIIADVLPKLYNNMGSTHIFCGLFLVITLIISDASSQNKENIDNDVNTFSLRKVSYDKHIEQGKTLQTEKQMRQTLESFIKNDQRDQGEGMLLLKKDLEKLQDAIHNRKADKRQLCWWCGTSSKSWEDSTGTDDDNDKNKKCKTKSKHCRKS